MLEYSFIQYPFTYTQGEVVALEQSVNVLLSQLTNQARTVSIQDLIQIVKQSRVLLVSERFDEQPSVIDSRWYQRGALIAMATLVPLYTPTGSRGRVEDVVVLQAYRGRGIGRALMARLIEEAKRLNLERLELSSRSSREGAHALYQSLGFERYETNTYRLSLRDASS